MKLPLVISLNIPSQETLEAASDKELNDVVRATRRATADLIEAQKLIANELNRRQQMRLTKVIDELFEMVGWPSDQERS